MNALEEKLLNRQEAFEEGEALGFERGEASGEAKGFERGEASGFERGEAKGRLDIAKNLLKKGMDKMDIAEITGLPMEEIKTL